MTADLLHAAIDEATLFDAWRKVRANQGAAGVDGQTIEQFGTNVLGRLQTLRDHVRRGEYRPQPLLQWAIPKANGKLRYLAVPTVRDRVLQTAAALVLTPLLDRAMEHASYAYRSGRSVQMAVARVAYWRDQGYQWVVDADIEGYFDNIPHGLLLDKLRRTLQDHSLVPLIELWLAATIQPADGSPPYLLTKGVPQGSPISPVLANLYLDDLDEAVLARDMRLVRFADDFVILCRDPAQAQQALELTEATVEALKLRINREKTRLVHFDEGFRFLGVDFIRNLMLAAQPGAQPWVIPDATTRQRAALHDTPAEAPDTDRHANEPPEPMVGETIHATTPPVPTGSQRPVGAYDGMQPYDSSFHANNDTDATAEDDPEPRIQLQHDDRLPPLLRSLVIGEHGVLILKENDRIIVARQGSELLSWPLQKLDEIHITGNALVSTALLRQCSRDGIHVTVSDSTGINHAHLGAPHPLADAHCHAQQVQRLADNDWSLMMARAVIHGKIHNQLCLLRRYNRRRRLTPIDQAIEQLDAMRSRLATTQTLDQVRGCEGQAARAYFGALHHLVPPQWTFEGRRKRPPTDPVNALLSYGYAVLHRTMVTLLVRQRIDPYLGAFHAPRAGHAALASDLIEEFRAPVVDTTVVHLLLSDTLTPGNFDTECGTGTVLLDKHARQTLVQALHAKLRSHIVHPSAAARMDYHRAMLWQVRHYRGVLAGRPPVYTPFLLR
ncbi:CRISPR-associated endonuclease Cas1 [Tepidimonas taiwanensis]|uniref:CRISPR-associated endonuclease Cas1 n=1 Tax=Tepidimonas taiwanensis TaxID=307486 RepID=A0A554X137_9BURK|nr:CRISPR-associated endonuclease Cas1 [Tepidimonas taiwanensis]TSE29547.1 CRISPR-associated endonuclease Cas1 [Tepidimonas taiwanensis]UBQ05139.1 CRISPR-associated endonuclease Cas1 [Tepidimonas taiwanensis]